MSLPAVFCLSAARRSRATRTGTTRGDFAIANAMGIHSVVPALTNWYFNDDVFCIASITGSWPTFPAAPGRGKCRYRRRKYPGRWIFIWWARRRTAVSPTLRDEHAPPHLIWQVASSNATVVAVGDNSRPYIDGEALWQGLVYLRRGVAAVDRSWRLGAGHVCLQHFPECHSMGVPIRVAAGRQEQSVAVSLRCGGDLPSRHGGDPVGHHFGINGSALFEYTNGASGDYYFCTGALRQDMPTDFITRSITALAVGHDQLWRDDLPAQWRADECQSDLYQASRRFWARVWCRWSRMSPSSLMPMAG